MKKEGHIDLLYFGGVRSGTDAAKLIAMGASAVVLGVIGRPGNRWADRPSHGLAFAADFVRTRTGCKLVVNLLKATVGEASMMARCTGKTNLHNLERSEDLRSITLASAEMTGIPLAGTDWRGSH